MDGCLRTVVIPSARTRGVSVWLLSAASNFRPSAALDQIIGCVALREACGLFSSESRLWSRSICNQQKYSSLCKHKMKCAALLNCICAENIELRYISTPASAPTVAASCSQHLLLALTFKLASRAKGPLTALYFNSTHCDSLIGEARCSQRRVWVRSGSVSELCLSGATALSQGNLKRSLF